MFCTAFGIALFLQQAVALTILRVAVTVLLPVAWMLRSPYLPAAFLVFLIVGVGSHLALLPAAFFPGSLTDITAAIFLIFDSRIGYKEAAAMDAALFRFHGLPPVETINRFA